MKGIAATLPVFISALRKAQRYTHCRQRGGSEADGQPSYSCCCLQSSHLNQDPWQALSQHRTLATHVQRTAALDLSVRVEFV